ncbi:MAG: Ppx/GppA family phosphatase [Rhizobiales bacterium]|nr:Ppx/GppA family phosphatase [Hyphomicrobiales bacterium]
MTDISVAPGRLDVGAPVAIVDIGSNSVRLVIYEGLTRAPTPLFNEKVLCGLGKGVATTGRLNPDSVEKALTALKRFRVLCAVSGVADIAVIATAAARDAENGPDFLAAAEAAIGAKVTLISSKREAELAALGIVSSFHDPDGVVGDLGGGSLELTDIRVGRGGAAGIGAWTSLQLGGLALMDRSGRSPKKAAKIVREALAGAKPLKELAGRTFYMVGGTWRALARLHMMQRSYPLHVMHGYVIPPRDAMDFARLVEVVNVDALVAIGAVSSARRPLLAYGAAVLEQIIRQARPSQIVVSALGVREGLLYERLDKATRRSDPLLAAARELNTLRSRSPRHGEELCDWTDAFFKTTKIDETVEERRLRHAACLLADIGWRAHPDYRGEQSLNIIAHAAFIGVDHPGRAFLALAASYRHTGVDDDVSPSIRALVSATMLDKARILGAAMRVAFIVSASNAGVLPRAALSCGKAGLALTLPRAMADLASDRLMGRMKQLARLIGREPRIVVAPD